MFPKKITYTDYNGVERTENFYFNLSKAEIAEMQLSEDGGLDKMLQDIIDKQDSKKLIKVFKDLILKSYGEKSPDGRRFIKSDDIQAAFSQTEAYSILFMELISNADSAVEFVKNIIPSDFSAGIDSNALPIINK